MGGGGAKRVGRRASGGDDLASPERRVISEPVAGPFKFCARSFNIALQLRPNPGSKTRKLNRARRLERLAWMAGNGNDGAMKTSTSSRTNGINGGISRRAALGAGATVAAGLLVGPQLLGRGRPHRKVVVWSEGTANVDPGSKGIYPNDINTAIADGLKPLEGRGWEIVKASLNDPDQGISDELLEKTDVLIWWGHKNMGR